MVLVNDASTDGTADWMNSLRSAFVTVVQHTENSGFARAMNAGAQAATGEFLVLLNNDLLLTPHWFEPFRACAQSWTVDLGIAGNVQLRTSDSMVDHAGVEFTALGRLQHVQHLDPSQLVRTSPLLTGACFMLPKRDFLEYGGFDTAYVNGAEDMALCLQALQRGRRNVVLNRSVIFHHVSVSRANADQDARNLANLVHLYEHWTHGLADIYASQYPEHNALNVIQAELMRLKALKLNTN